MRCSQDDFRVNPNLSGDLLWHLVIGHHHPASLTFSQFFITASVLSIIVPL